jgi:hypothetical protein
VFAHPVINGRLTTLLVTSLANGPLYFGMIAQMGGKPVITSEFACDTTKM